MSPELHFKFLKSLNDEELEVYADHGDPDAQYLLGFRLYINHSIRYMFQKPLALLKASAYAGNMNAQEKLGDIFASKSSITTLCDDIIFAIGMYTLAEKQGSETAGMRIKQLLSQLKIS